MNINFNCTGDRRKALVKAISELVGVPAEYQFMPTQAYKIGDFTVNKGGQLIFDDFKEAETLLEGLEKMGFFPENRLILELPESLFDDRVFANLDRILENRHQLICHALQTENLRYFKENGVVKFPWFALENDEDSAVYAEFLTALVRMATEQKRVNNKPCETNNEKYTMRCFLLRMGFIGKEHKAVRTAMLRHLSGCSAFRDGRSSESGGGDF